MTEIISLLTLPTTSNAFTALTPSIADPSTRSPPRKKVRLEPASSHSDSGFSSGSRSNAGARRIECNGEEIRKPSDKDLDSQFSHLNRCVRVLLTKDAKERLPLTYETIYTTCQSLVRTANRGQAIYDFILVRALDGCVNGLARELLDSTAEGAEWVVPFVQICSWFEKRITLLQSLLTYLDQIYLPTRLDLPGIREVAYGAFRRQIFGRAGVKGRLSQGIKEWIEWERENRSPHPLRPSISYLISHLHTHTHYTPLFESPYLSFTQEFYTTESKRCFDAFQADPREFRRHVKQRLVEEEARAREVLREESWVVVVRTSEQALLGGRLEWLGKTALAPSMDSKNLDELSEMYELFARVNELRILVQAFKAYVESAVKAIVKDVAHDDTMVPRLLDLKSFLDQVLSTAFSPSNSPSPVPVNFNPREFTYALQDAFRSSFKSRRLKPAEQIAKHIDFSMRRGQKDSSDDEFDRMLGGVLGLYGFSEDKDVFRAYYHRGLAKRLLLGRSASDDFEKAVIKKLKEEYDPEFGTGESMFTDLTLSRDMLQEHHSKLSSDDPSRKLTVMVLQRSVWPFAARKIDTDLPPSMQDELIKYTAFYKTKHQGRKLEWDHALGTATMTARFKAGKKELSVSLYQAVVLLLFNEADQISFGDVKAQVRMDDADLRRTLQSLACGKKRVLKKRPAGPDVNDGDVFFYNADFTDPRAKVHINSIQVKETPEESKRTESAIEGDRRYYLDAAIVRIMKSKKRLSYEQLKTATIDAVKSHFIPEVSMIKQRIQALLEQEYVKRDEEDMNVYVYVA